MRNRSGCLTAFLGFQIVVDLIAVPYHLFVRPTMVQMMQLSPSTIPILRPPAPPWLYALVSLAYCVAVIAIWKWKRWGLYAYIALAIPVTFGIYLLVGTILDAFIGLGSGLVMIAILIFLLQPVWEQMD